MKRVGEAVDGNDSRPVDVNAGTNESTDDDQQKGEKRGKTKRSFALVFNSETKLTEVVCNGRNGLYSTAGRCPLYKAQIDNTTQAHRLLEQADPGILRLCRRIICQVSHGSTPLCERRRVRTSVILSWYRQAKIPRV